MRIDYEYYSDVGGRSENEDSVGLRRYGNIVTAVLADGLGGQGDGKAASELVRDRLLGCGANGAFPTEQEISEAFTQTNHALLTAQKNQFHMKTTAVLLCLDGTQAIWAHVGDSRLYHIHKGELKHYTLDHSAAQMAVFLGSARREDIPRDPGRNRLIKAMGIAEITADVHQPVALEPVGRHAFLMCSDGLWEYLTDAEIAEAMNSAQKPGEALERLRRLKQERCASDCDNHSAILIFLDWR